MSTKQQDIPARRAQIEARLKELRHRQGEAVLDGKAGSGAQAEIARLERELEALTSAEGIQAERARDSAEAARLAKAAEIRSEMSSKLRQYLEAVEFAEHAARDYVANIQDAIRLNGELAKDAGRLNDYKRSPLPAALQTSECIRRLSGMFGSVLRLWEGRPHGKHFGLIEWRNVSLWKSSDEWKAQEEKIMRRQLSDLLKDAMPEAKTETKPDVKLIEQRKEDVTDFTGDGAAK